jgi:hypothetical protein
VYTRYSPGYQRDPLYTKVRPEHLITLYSYGVRARKTSINAAGNKSQMAYPSSNIVHAYTQALPIVPLYSTSGSKTTTARTRQNEASCLEEKLETRLVKFGTSCTSHVSCRIARTSSARLTAAQKTQRQHQLLLICK